MTKSDSEIDFDQDLYQECLKIAQIKHQKGQIKLCPRGYCTAKQKFKVYPSAYANGYASQVCSGKKPDLTSRHQNDYDQPKSSATTKDSDLTRWYKEQWVNVCEKDKTGNYLPCGRKSASLKREDYPYCRPLLALPGTVVKSVNELTPDELLTMCKKKRSIDPGVDGSPTRVYVKSLDRLKRQTKETQTGGNRVSPSYNDEMELDDQFNPLKHLIKKTVLSNGSEITLYKPFQHRLNSKQLSAYIIDPLNSSQIQRVDFKYN